MFSKSTPPQPPYSIKKDSGLGYTEVKGAVALCWAPLKLSFTNYIFYSPHFCVAPNYTGTIDL